MRRTTSLSMSNATMREQPQLDYPSLIAVLAGLQVPFLCTETHELGEELVASYLYQVHLYHWLETNDYGRFLSDQDLCQLSLQPDRAGRVSMRESGQSILD